MTDHDERKRRIRATWEAAWNQGDLTAVDRLFSPDYVRHARSGGETLGRDAYKQSILESRTGFPDIVVTIEDIISETDRIALRWVCTGHHLGEYRGVPPTGRVVNAAGMMMARFEGDVITEAWVTWDPRNRLAALGIVALGDLW